MLDAPVMTSLRADCRSHSSSTELCVQGEASQRAGGLLCSVCGSDLSEATLQISIIRSQQVLECSAGAPFLCLFFSYCGGFHSSHHISAFTYSIFSCCSSVIPGHLFSFFSYPFPPALLFFCTLSQHSSY